MVGILLISTRKYKQFVQPLLEQIEKYFLPDHPKRIFLFTDEFQKELKTTHSLVHQFLIPPYRFPYATLYRYKVFSDHADELGKCSHLFYMDVDMAVVGNVGNEFITNGIVCVRHPGFFKNNGWGDSNNPIESKSYLPKEQRRHYVCGGVQGGRSDIYLAASKFMAEGIAEDEKNGVMAEWNDETFWNHYIHTQTENMDYAEFNPSYCMVEDVARRKSWGIDDLEVKIVGLNKNHEEIRN